MKTKSIPVLGAILLAMVFFFTSCKKTNEIGTLTVIISEGVSGTLAAGVFYFNVGDEVVYSFSLDASYEKLTVLLDGTAVEATGTITVSGDHTLQAYSDENGQFTLTVTLATGVSGTPAAGTFTHAQGTLVNYSYILAEGYTDLIVKLDGSEVASSGTITMADDHALSTTVTVGKNIQGSWLLTETYDDDSSFDVTATFSGNYVSGKVTDSDGGSGTYTYADSTVAFSIVFSGVTYEYSGTFSDYDTMSGTCKRYQTEDNVISGTWSATRNTAATTARGKTPAVNPLKKGDRRQGIKKWVP